MMAPAMNTRPDERLPYLELARQGARVVRSLEANRLQRLAEIASGHDELRVELRFDVDGQGRPWVRAATDVTVRAACQRCLETFDHRMQAAFELCILNDADEASALAAEADVLVADSEAITVADVVEDELILALPERLCREIPCPHAPPLAYPADDAPEENDNPFQVLAELKRRL